MKSHSPSAEDLLARVVERDVGALGELYDRFAPSLLGMVHQILPDRTQAETVIEEVFVKLWSEARRLSQEGASVAAALVFMARGQAISLLHAPRKPPRNSDRAAAFLNSYSWLPRPEEITLFEGRLELLSKVVTQLPKAQRGVLNLAVFEGSTEEEIARKLGEPLGSVQSSLLAALRFMRHRLGAVLRTWTANI